MKVEKDKKEIFMKNYSNNNINININKKKRMSLQETKLKEIKIIVKI